jgi:hypothetical protein
MSIIQDALNVYKKIVHTSLRDALLIASQEPQRRGIYSSSVVIWLMIFQRLNKDHSLSAALEHLCSGSLDDLLKEGSLPARSKKISSATGGLARARERVSLECIEKTADGINEALEQCHKKNRHEGKKVFVIDGTTIRSAHTEKNIKEYPQYKNQHGEAHYPLIRVCVATNAMTGVAMRPAYGAYNGKDAVGELTLADELFARIPAGSIILGDRYFGCSRFAQMAENSKHTVITRVKEINAKKFIGTPATPSGEVTAVWQSRINKSGESYQAQGRFIWHTVERKGFRPVKLILFTTTTLPRKEVVELYTLRWNVELDLRDIKSTLDMDMLYSKTPSMSEKELLLGFVAYNLVRHLVVAVANSLKVTPREISFSRVLKRVHALGEAAYGGVLAPDSLSAFTLHTKIKCFLLPKRVKKKIAEPRKVWQKGQINYMTTSREIERQLIQKATSDKHLEDK